MFYSGSCRQEIQMFCDENMLRKQENDPISDASMWIVESFDSSFSPVPGNTIGTGLEEFLGSGNSAAKIRKDEIIEFQYWIVARIQCSTVTQL